MIKSDLDVMIILKVLCIFGLNIVKHITMS